MAELTQADLPPCPFCGSADAFVERSDLSSCHVVCNDCGARGPSMCNENDADVEAEDNGAEPGEIAARRAWADRHRAESVASCAAGPDRADILETIESAAPGWQGKGYATALAEVRDMANVGRALIDAIADMSSGGPLKGWSPADCPSEVVSDLVNMVHAVAPLLNALAKVLPSGSSSAPDEKVLAFYLTHGELRAIKKLIAIARATTEQKEATDV